MEPLAWLRETTALNSDRWDIWDPWLGLDGGVMLSFLGVFYHRICTGWNAALASRRLSTRRSSKNLSQTFSRFLPALSVGAPAAFDAYLRSIDFTTFRKADREEVRLLYNSSYESVASFLLFGQTVTGCRRDMVDVFPLPLCSRTGVPAGISTSLVSVVYRASS